jgi:ring-1,2-phenylacetyl-CoA epoxidase subunit PaaC
MANHDDLIQLLLRLADNGMINGQRMCEWCGKAPELEEELALMNVGLDLIGQARNWYEYAAELLNDGRSADDLAFRRNEREYRNLLLLEQPNGDFAITITRQFLFDAWHRATLKALSTSLDERVRGIAAKGLKEVTYHFTRSSEWMQRLGDGTQVSHDRMVAAVDSLWRFTVELTECNSIDKRLFEVGIGPDPEFRAKEWWDAVNDVFEAATLSVPEPAAAFYLSGTQGLHTEHLGLLLAEMQHLQRAYPDATW